MIFVIRLEMADVERYENFLCETVRVNGVDLNAVSLTLNEKVLKNYLNDFGWKKRMRSSCNFGFWKFIFMFQEKKE